MTIYESFDYVRTDDGIIHIVRGITDQTLVHALPLYYPDSNGGRKYNGTNYSRYSRDSIPQPKRGEYNESKLSHTAVSFPADKVVESKKPFASRNRVTNTIRDWKVNIYRIIRDLCNSYNIPTSIIGSDLFGLETSASDLDLLLAVDSTSEFYEICSKITNNTNLIPLPDTFIWDLARKYASVYNMQVGEIRRIMEIPIRRLYNSKNKKRVTLIPTHKPAKDKQANESFDSNDLRSLRNISAEVVDNTKACCMPREYKVWSEEYGSIRLITYHYIYAATFDVADKIIISGDYIQSQHSLYVRHQDHTIRYQ